MFAIQMFVNVGMVIGIMPITGHPVAVPQLRRHGDAGELRRGGHPAQRAHAALQVGARQRAGALPETIHTNVEPSVLVDSRTTSPSIARADMRASVRPSPTPWWVRVLRSSRLLQRLEDAVERRRLDASATVDHAHVGDPAFGRDADRDRCVLASENARRVLDELFDDATRRGPVEAGHRRPRRGIHDRRGRASRPPRARPG